MSTFWIITGLTVISLQLLVSEFRISKVSHNALFRAHEFPNGNLWSYTFTTQVMNLLKWLLYVLVERILGWKIMRMFLALDLSIITFEWVTQTIMACNFFICTLRGLNWLLWPPSAWKEIEYCSLHSPLLLASSVVWNSLQHLFFKALVHQFCHYSRLDFTHSLSYFIDSILKQHTVFSIFARKPSQQNNASIKFRCGAKKGYGALAHGHSLPFHIQEVL